MTRTTFSPPNWWRVAVFVSGAATTAGLLWGYGRLVAVSLWVAALLLVLSFQRRWHHT